MRLACANIHMITQRQVLRQVSDELAVVYRPERRMNAYAPAILMHNFALIKASLRQGVILNIRLAAALTTSVHLARTHSSGSI